MKQKRRIFIAINLPEDGKRFLVAFQEKYQGLPAKWTPKDQLHITLVFLGDIDDQELADTCQMVSQVVKQQEPFSIHLQTVAYGPVGKIPPRYIWAGGQASEKLSAVKRNVENALLEKIDFARDTKALAPHVTLARIKEWEWRAIEPEERPEVGELIDLEIPVESLEIMESELKRGGPVYTILESHPLGNE